MSWRLLLIEARRTPALWLVVPLVFLCFRTYGDRFTPHVPLWILTSVAIGQAATIIGPPVAGIAAWIAGRERRRGAQELLATTSYSPVSRLLITWLATTGCGLLIYGLFAAGGGIVTARGASWGGPDPWLILAGAATIMAYCAIGFAIGVALPYRFIAPLVALGLLIGQEAITIFSVVKPRFSAVQYLFPVARDTVNVWYGSLPDNVPFRLLMYLALLGVVWAVLALRLARFKSVKSWASLALAILLLITGVAQALAHIPTPVNRLARFSGYGDSWYDTAEIRPYTLACSDAPIQVCVHPAYQPWLGELSTEVNTLLAPLVGLPGMPQRAEQVPPRGRRADATTPIVYIPFSLDHRNLYEAKRYAVDCAIFSCTADLEDIKFRDAVRPDARAAIARWLRLRIGDTPEGPYSRSCFPQPGQDTFCLAAERFAALDPATQRAWLEAHFADLRAGRVTLGEMP